jgi:hypothetical protein
MNRRALLLGLLPAGCAALKSDQQALSQVVNRVQLIASAFEAIIPDFGTVPGMTIAVVTKINQALADLQKTAGEINLAQKLNDARPVVMQVERDITTVVSIMATFSIVPSPIALALQAAQVILPLLFAAVNLALPPQRRGGERFASQMTPPQAESTLRVLAVRHYRGDN